MVLVEGTTDQRLFDLADRLARRAGRSLLGQEIVFVASGRSDEGGTFGVAREFTTMRSLAAIPLDARGRPAYRVVGLLDNDHAGRRAIRDVLRNYRGAQEFVDVLAIGPVMPVFTCADARGRRQHWAAANRGHEALDWEIEDALSPRLLSILEQTRGSEITRRWVSQGRTHYDLTRRGKTELHRIAQDSATLEDLMGIVNIVRTVRSMVGLPDVAF
jgi:hypothetical protein